jgi:hypothetical protein
MNDKLRPHLYLWRVCARLTPPVAVSIWGVTIAVLVVGGCSSVPPPQQAATGLAPLPTECVGSIEPPYGLTPISDPTLLSKSVLKPTKGGLCMGEAFQVTQPLAVYRVWDSAKPWGEYGTWWSFTPPAGPRDIYRIKNEICPSWSHLDRVTQCRLKVGADIVIGPGQSVQCGAQDGDIGYPQSAETQVYVPNDTSDPSKQFISDCIAATAWP